MSPSAENSVSGNLRWFIVRTLHLSGRACADLSLNDRAANFLSTCRDVLHNSGDDINTALVVAQDLADVCISLNEPHLAVKLYEEATTTYELLGRPTEANTSRLLLEDARNRLSAKTGSKAKAIDQQNCSGTGEVVTKQAAGEVGMVGENDKVSVMLQLAATYTLSADWDRAIDYLRQSVHLIEDVTLKCSTLRRLGTLYHVKANTLTLTELRQQSLAKAEHYYVEAAIMCTTNMAVAVFHAALCLQQERYSDALLKLLPVNHSGQAWDDVVTLCTYETSLLPYCSLHVSIVCHHGQ